MSWINSNATYKQNSKNDLSFYHGFSKTPVEPTSTGTAATTLGNASTKGGHTVIGTEVWAEEIPWFGLVPSRAVAVTRLSGLTKLNDLVKVDGEGGKVYKYIGADDATFTEAQWSSFWQEVTLTNGMTLNNRHNQPVLRYYLNQPMQTLTTTNNASIDSKGYATRLFVDESNHTGQTSGGSVVSQFAAGTDNIKNGIPSVELNPKLYLGTTEKIAGTHYYDYNVSGTVLWSTAVTSSSPKISCFRYIGKTVTGQLSTVDSTVKSHALDIADIKLALGMNPNPDSPTTSVTARVETVEDVVRTLLGLGSDAPIAATESISATANSAATSAITSALTEGGSIAQAIATAKSEALEAIGAIQHFSVEIVPEGQTIDTITLVPNTIYLVKDTNSAAGDYIEYIAFTSGEETKVEKIGTTAIDLTGYTTDEEYALLASTEEGKKGRVTILEEKVATLTGSADGSVSKALADAKTYAEGQASAAKSGAETTAANALSAARTEITAEIAQAKSEAIASAEVTITAGTGIVVTGEGKGTTFQIAVSDDVATAASVSALSQVVASNKIELEGKIDAISDASTDAVNGLKETAITSQSVSGAGVSVTLGGKVGAPTLTGSVTPATYTSSTKSWTNDSNFAKASDIATAISDAVGAIVIPDVEASPQANSLGFQVGTHPEKSTHYIHLATAGYTPAVGETPASWNTNTKGYLITGATVEAFVNDETAKTLDAAKAYSNSLHTTSVTYHVTDTLPTVQSGEEEKYKGRIYLVLTGLDGVQAASGDRIEYMYVQENGVWGWEQIGTTSAELSGYASSVTINGQTYNVTANTVALGSGFANKVATGQATNNANQSSVYANIAIDGTLTLGVASATDSVMGVSKLFGGHYLEMASVEDKSNTAVSLQTVSDMFLTIDDVLDDKAEKSQLITNISSPAYTSLAGYVVSTENNGNYGKSTTITHALIGTDSFQIGCSVYSGYVRRVDGNVASLQEGNQELIKVEIAPEKFVNGITTFAGGTNLKSWVSDMPNLTDGTAMFKNCTQLTTFIGDLSSLETADEMFYGCTLDAESLEILADTLPTVTSGTIDIGASTNATDEVIATIKGKGWTLKSNGTAL